MKKLIKTATLSAKDDETGDWCLLLQSVDATTGKTEAEEGPMNHSIREAQDDSGRRMSTMGRKQANAEQECVDAHSGFRDFGYTNHTNISKIRTGRCSPSHGPKRYSSHPLPSNGAVWHSPIGQQLHLRLSHGAFIEAVLTLPVRLQTVP